MQFFSDKAESEVAVNRKKRKASQGCGPTNVFHLFYSRGYFLLMEIGELHFCCAEVPGGESEKGLL